MADRLGQTRASRFVGRTGELEAFDRLLRARDEPAVVFVHGPAGIGKSTLLRQFAVKAIAAGADCLALDARDLPPTMDGLAYGLQHLLDADAPRRSVVLIDTYERLTELDRPLREHLAPRLPADTVLVLAGQYPPSVGWRTDEGWAALLHTMRLGNLTADECAGYLSGRGVDPDQQPPAIAFTHGHPLALALVGEVIREQGSFSAGGSADVVRVLIERLLEVTPTSTHRAAVEAAAQVRVVTEPLLAAMLDIAEVSELFGWLRGQPFVDSGRSGLYLHDLARDVLAADLRWRHPDQYAALHARAREHYLDRLGAGDPLTQTTALLDLIYLHPDLRAFLQPPDETAALHVEPARPGDTEAVVAAVLRHEGPESAALAKRWLAEQPGSWVVVRGPGEAVEGALCLLRLEATRLDDPDPAVVAAHQELGLHPALRPGETATLFRFWFATADYQAVSPAQSLIATQLARHFLTSPGLALTVMPFAQPQDWVAFCAYADQRRAPAADFTVGGRTYTGFVHDWRLAPPAAWVARMSVQEVGAPASPPVAVSAPAALVLGEAEFAAAVRQALKDYPRPERLRSSALLRCRIVTSALAGGETPAEQVTKLKEVLKAAVETLAAVPADRRLHRVLVRAYLAPAPTLERAAEVLEMPSSTFRRLLTTAIGRVTTLLWQAELDG